MPPASSRRVPIRPLALALLGIVVAAPAARADFTTINFDTVPILAVAPTTFSVARQDLTIAGLATVAGGTPISTPAGLASFGPGGGQRNAYGTRSGTGLGYLQNLTINFDPSKLVTRVQGTLFNGFADMNSYTVSIFNGAAQVGTTTFLDVPDTSTPTGFRNWDLAAAAITRLVITPDTTFSGGAWNYFIDNVGVTFTPAAVPEPSSLLMLGAGLSALASLRIRTWPGTVERRRGA